MISVEDLRVDYDQFCAVHDLSFEVGKGEVFGLIGPNGSGKTTTMRALVGLLEPTYGNIRISGIDVRENPESVGQIMGFMPDFPPVYEDLMVWEFLDLFASAYYVPKANRQREIHHWLEQVGLTEKTYSLVGGLSRGMRQRLMLAKTMLPEPRVLLLDEPASGMDPHGRAQMKQVIREFAADGGTVLISSHILSEMDEFCTSIGVMERGQMVVTGTMDEIANDVSVSAALLIELIDGEDKLMKIMAKNQLTGLPFTNDKGLIEIPFEGDSTEASELLTELIMNGVTMSSFTRKRESLEDVFLQIGAKEVS
jgi:ABC-2 type transport system ATP-binding protein